MSPNNSAIQMNSNRRGIYFLVEADPDDKTKTKIMMIAEPPPDTALEAAIKALGEVSAKGTGSASLDTSQSIVQLSHASSVLILRDALFRLTEASANGVLKADDYKTEFDTVVKAATEIADKEADTAKSNADKAKSETEKGKAAAIQSEGFKALGQQEKEQFLQSP